MISFRYFFIGRRKYFFFAEYNNYLIKKINRVPLYIDGIVIILTYGDKMGV